VFGNHKTALKAGFGKFNDQYSTGFTNNFNPMTGVGLPLTWTGFTVPGTKTLVPACTPVKVAGLDAPNPNCFPTGGFNGVGALPGVGAGTLLGGSSTFGNVLGGTGVTLDPNWHRDYNFQYNAGIQQQLASGITLNFNWYRRSVYQQTQITNFAVPLSAWVSTIITNPLDGKPITFYSLPTSTRPAALTYQTNAPQSLVKNVYSGFESSVVARLPRNTFILFGWTIDRDLDRSCSMSAGTSTGITGLRLNDPNTLRYCDEFGELYQSLGAVSSPPWQNEFKVSGAVPLRWGFIASASFYSNRYQYGWTPAPTPGGISTGGVTNNGYLARTWTLNKSTVYPANCVGCTPGAPVFPDPAFVMGQGPETINLVAPGQVLTPRLNQLDIGLKKTFIFRERWRLEPEVQAFNILNSNAAVTEAVSAPSSPNPLLPGDIAPLLPKSACTSAAGPKCGLGGPVTVITNPRLLRVALLFRF
jgi:hypothetical protein